MSAVVFLDAGPLGALSNPTPTSGAVACQARANSLRAAGRRVIVPEVTDYKVRRELLRARKPVSASVLDALAVRFEYLPLTTVAMRLAAELWAQARNTGRPTASDAELDADVILAAQALTLGVADVVVATTNPGHIARFVPAELWQNVTP